jgi:hypothetical protein
MSFGELTRKDWGFTHNVVVDRDKNKTQTSCHYVESKMENYQ